MVDSAGFGSVIQHNFVERFTPERSVEKSQKWLMKGMIDIRRHAFFSCPVTMGSASSDLCDREAASHRRYNARSVSLSVRLDAKKP